MVVVHLAISIVIILLGARFFTNGVEWLGVRLGLARGPWGACWPPSARRYRKP
ncbi:MAG: hypothetical protein ACUVRC_07605 [Desulfotomaculales bacterium]